METIKFNRPRYEDLRDGDIYESLQQDIWVKCKIKYHFRGQPMIEILEGNLKGKEWYLFPDLQNIRFVITITHFLLENGFSKFNSTDFCHVGLDCIKRVGELHFLFWSESMKHFSIGVMNDSNKKQSAGVHKKFNIIMLPKPIYTTEEAKQLIKSITIV